MFSRARFVVFAAALISSTTVVMSNGTAHAVTPPGKVRNLAVTVTAVDRGTGAASLDVEFDDASPGGGPTDHYEVDVCHVPGGALSCTTGFVPLVNIPFAPGHVVVPGSPTCPAGFSNCFFRVRGVDSTGTVFSAPTTTGFAPWTPYSVTASSGPGVGQVTVGFDGPSESGASGPGSQHYVASVCTSACGLDSNWTDSGLSIPYPPSGTGPFSAPPYNCGVNANCSFRLQFVDGAGAVSSLSEAVAAVGPVLTIDQPTAGEATNDPTVGGACTIDGGTVTATVNPGANAFTSDCSPSGTWSLSIVSRADAVYSVTASQAGSPLPTAGPVSFTYDTTAPVTSDNTASLAGWHTAPVTVTLTPTDALSGVAATYYTTDGSTPTTGSASGTSINLATDGIYTIKYFSVDVAGNVEAVETAGTPVMIDQHAPVTTDNTASLAGWHTSPVTVTLSPTDALSGVAATYYTTDGSTPTTGSASGTSINIATDGIYTIKYFSVDVAGNAESVKTAGTPVMVDQHAPVITFTPANGRSVGPTRWAAECTTPGICGSVTDTPSGVASFGPATVRRVSDGKYWTGTAWQNTAVNAPVTGTAASWSIALSSSNLNNGVSYTVTMHATDVAGNSVTSSSTFTYDSTKPSVVSVATGNGNGAVGSGDSFAVTFSKAIDPASVAGPTTLTMSRSSTSATKYEIAGLTNGALSTGSTGYVTSGSGTRTVTYNGTTSVSGSVVTFTVTSACTSGCAFATTGAPAGIFTYKPAATITDLAGNDPMAAGVTSGNVVIF